MESAYGFRLWNPPIEAAYGVLQWKSTYGVILWNPPVESACEVRLSACSESAYEESGRPCPDLVMSDV